MTSANFFFVHIFVDSFETYETSVLQMRHEKHKGEKNTNIEGLKIKADHFLQRISFHGFQTPVQGSVTGCKYLLKLIVCDMIDPKLLSVNANS